MEMMMLMMIFDGHDDVDDDAIEIIVIYGVDDNVMRMM